MLERKQVDYVASGKPSLIADLPRKVLNGPGQLKSISLGCRQWPVGRTWVLLVYNSTWLPINSVTLEESHHHTELQFPYLKGSTYLYPRWETEAMNMPKVPGTWYAFDEL